ncbi:MAG: SDR family oxidoreductase [Candidatus Pacearchaeota archaeon]|nr:SDR family oxidoreductase [Candidatus Pacearchaeota archaeon]
MFSLLNKVAIVTGSARGIGQAIAVEFARQGADVVVSDIIPGDDTLKKIKTLKRKAIYVKTDVTNKKDIENLINETIKNFKKIDILVNNAGIFITQPTLDCSQENWDKTININLRGYFLCAQAALKHMKKGASIINISSVAGISGYAMAAAYCASKGGVRLLTKSLAVEFGPKGIRVNSIHPGIIETAMTQGILEDKKIKESTISKLPLRRTGQPIDIAGPAVFLASDAASYITGEELVVDGGWIAGL